MTKKIETLVKDIDKLFTQTHKGKGTILHEDVLSKFGAGVALAVQRTLTARREEGRKPNTIYMSEVGQPCMRKTWYGYHKPELAESLQGHSQFKFLYGDLIEETALTLAQAAGHKVERRQERVEYTVNGYTVAGRIDAVIDGVLVDVKSASPYAYKKFEEGLTDANDSFGYRAQLSGYNGVSLPAFKQQGFFAIDKQNGHMGYFPSKWEATTSHATLLTVALGRPKEPMRHYKLVPEGKSGNMKLCMECSYCPFKQECWKDANHGEGLKAYAYSYGPVFLGVEVNKPRVPEIPLTPPGKPVMVAIHYAGPVIPITTKTGLIHGTYVDEKEEDSIVGH